GEQLVYEAVVEVETFRVRLAGALGEDPRPGDGEPIGVRAETLHQRDVLLVPVVVVVSDVAGVIVLDVPGSVAIGIPDRQALAVLVPRALDLVRGRADAPVEAVRELAGRFWLRFRLVLGLGGGFEACHGRPEAGPSGGLREIPSRSHGVVS